jgi:uncharacterized protein YegP (UPF0339 family)
MGKFVIGKRSNGEFQFNLKADNNQIILTSEGYTTKASCQNGIESVKKNSGSDDSFERKVATNGKHYFSLKAANAQIIGMSQMYETIASMEIGITSVKNNAPSAGVLDEA